VVRTPLSGSSAVANRAAARVDAPWGDPVLAAVAPILEPTPAQRLADYVERLRRRWPLVVGLTLLVTGAALAISISKPKQYKASSTLLFPQTNAIPGATVSQPVDPERETNTNVALATLQPVASRVKARLRLTTSPQDLLTHVKASAVGTSDLIAITVQEPDPALAARVANAFANEYVQFRHDTANASLAEAAQAIASQLQAIPLAQRTSPAATALANREAQIQAAQALQTGGVQIVRPATRPMSAASPHPKSTAIIAAVLGLLFAAAVALVLDLVDHRLKDEEVIEGAFGLPILATLPTRWHMPSDDGVAAPDPQRDAASLLAANLRRAGLGEGTLLISGTGREDGQTQIALGLAQALAHLGEVIVAIEADSGDAWLAGLLEIHAGRDVGRGAGSLAGLEAGNGGAPHGAESLAAPHRGQSLDDALIEIDAATLRPVSGDDLSVGARFFVLPLRGASSAMPSAAPQALLSAAKSSADIVLVPTSTLEHALALAYDAEGILLVAQRNRTTRDAATRALRLLRNSDVRPYGLVVIDPGFASRPRALSATA
jgi:capsular polysaccharide biosynthesis protein